MKTTIKNDCLYTKHNTDFCNKINFPWTFPSASKLLEKIWYFHSLAEDTKNRNHKSLWVILQTNVFSHKDKLKETFYGPTYCQSQFWPFWVLNEQGEILDCSSSFKVEWQILGEAMTWAQLVLLFKYFLHTISSSLQVWRKMKIYICVINSTFACVSIKILQ